MVLDKRLLESPDELQEPKKSRWQVFIEDLLIKIPCLHFWCWAPLIYFLKTSSSAIADAYAPVLFGAWALYGLWKYIVGGITSGMGLVKMIEECKKPHDWWRRDSLRYYRDFELHGDTIGNGENMLHFDDVIHLVVIPTYNEDIETLQGTLHKLSMQERAYESIIVVLAIEARMPNAQSKAESLIQEFGLRFKDMMVTMHEIQLGETPGKASNVNWGVRCAKTRIVDVDGVDVSNILVTVCDADSSFHPNFFAALTHGYVTCTSIQRRTRFWQGCINFYPNMDEVPGLCAVRFVLVAVGYLGHLASPLNFPLPFSTYSCALELVLKAHYYNPSIISEDWHMFFRCFFATNGEAHVKPIFLPIGCDCPVGDSTVGTLRSCHQQAVRWQWGASDIGVLVMGLVSSIKVRPFRSLLCAVTFLEQHLLFPLLWLINTAWIWVIFQGRRELVIIWVVCYVMTIICTAALDNAYCNIANGGKLISAGRTVNTSWMKWIPAFPVTDILFHILPTIEAQFRMMIAPRRFMYVTAAKSKKKIG